MVSGTLAAVGAGGYALAVSGTARWIFVLVVAAAAVSALLEGRPAARARAEAEALPASRPDGETAASGSRLSQLLGGLFGRFGSGFF